MRSREFPGSKIRNWKREVKMSEFMQRRNGMWQMGKRRRRRRWRRKGGDASHSWVSQGNWMEVVVGGGYCSSWERAIIWYHQTVMNLYCQEKRDDSMTAKEVGAAGNGSERSQKLEGSKRENRNFRQIIEGWRSLLSKGCKCLVAARLTLIHCVCLRNHTHIRATRQKHELKTKCPDKWGKGKKTCEMWRWLEAKVMEGPSSACGRITRL